MTRLRDKVPVPALDELRLARIEQRVLAAADARPAVPRRRASRAIGWAVAAVAVAGVALAVFLNWRASQRGGVADGAAVPTQPVVIETGADSARVAVGDAVVVVGPHTEAEIARGSDDGTSVWLERGRVDCEVEPRPGRAPFVVRAGKVDVTVVGTVFSVEREGDEVNVRVTRGKVAVGHGGEKSAVAAGEQWSEVSGTVAIAAPAAGAPASAKLPPASAKLPPASAPARDDAGQTAATGPSALRDHVAEAPAASAATGQEGDSAASGATTAGAEAPRKSSQTGAKPERAPSARSGSPCPGLDDAFALEKSDPRGAVDSYRARAFGENGAVASCALYRMAHVQYYRLGQHKEAAATTDVYRRRFRSGREAEAALWLRVLALCKVGEAEACRAAAHTFRERYPQSAHADDATRIINQ